MVNGSHACLNDINLREGNHTLPLSSDSSIKAPPALLKPLSKKDAIACEEEDHELVQREM